MLDQPMWACMPFTPPDVPFLGKMDSAPDEVGTPYQYFKAIVTDEMLFDLANETNSYALQKKW